MVVNTLSAMEIFKVVDPLNTLRNSTDDSINALSRTYYAWEACTPVLVVSNSVFTAWLDCIRKVIFYLKEATSNLSKQAYSTIKPSLENIIVSILQ
jgi:hypothetical protein